MKHIPSGVIDAFESGDLDGLEIYYGEVPESKRYMSIRNPACCSDFQIVLCALHFHGDHLIRFFNNP